MQLQVSAAVSPNVLQEALRSLAPALKRSWKQGYIADTISSIGSHKPGAEVLDRRGCVDRRGWCYSKRVLCYSSRVGALGDSRQ